MDNIRIYPTPTSDFIFLHFSTAQLLEQVEISILNIVGQTITNKQYGTLIGPQQFSFDLSKQRSGMYWVVLRSEQGVSSWKVVKN